MDPRKARYDRLKKRKANNDLKNYGINFDEDIENDSNHFKLYFIITKIEKYKKKLKEMKVMRIKFKISKFSYKGLIIF